MSFPSQPFDVTSVGLSIPIKQDVCLDEVSVGEQYNMLKDFRLLHSLVSESSNRLVGWT